MKLSPYSKLLVCVLSLFPISLKAAGFGDIPASLAMPAGQAVRRNAGNTAFEAYTPTGSGTVTSIATTSPITGGTITSTGTIDFLHNVDLLMTTFQHITVDDSVNNDVSVELVLTHTTSGSAASGLGSGIDFQSETSLTIPRVSGKINSAWSDATDLTRTSYMDFRLVNNAALNTKMRLFGSGALSINNTADPGVPGISARFIPQANSTTSATSWTPDANSYDQEAQTALAGDLTVNAPSGTPSDGKKLILRIKSNGSGHNITWDGAYVAMGVTLPASISASKTIYAGCDYNSNTSKWDVLAVAIEP